MSTLPYQAIFRQGDLLSMAKCPACRSTRVYKGYRPAPLLLRLVRIHEFLCENCNLQFRGFSILPPRSRKRKGKNRNEQDDARIIAPAPPVNLAEFPSLPQARNHTQYNPVRAQAAGAGTTGPSPSLPPKTMASQNEPAKPANRGQWELPAEALEELENSRRSHRSHQTCPSCGATDTERRRRKMWEKAAFAFTSIRAYKCRICGSDFYARRKLKTDE